MTPFHIATDIYHGENALDRLLRLDATRVFLVADPFVVTSGLIAHVTDRLSAASIPFDLFSEIVPDPPVETVAAGVKALLASGAPAIVAIGGGSALDTAKLIREFAARMDASLPRPRLVAIPTTSGTGSEVTSVAVLTDAARQVKIPISSDSLLPDEAILDVELVKTVPPPLVADTGMDVFTHAVEACVSLRYSDFSAAFAAKSIEIVGAYLLRSYLDASDLHARAKMHSASCLAGLAFNASSLGLNHAVSHALGARFHIPHGRANAIALPRVVEYNSGIGPHSRSRADYDHTVRCYATIARILGLQNLNVITTVRALVNWIEFMMKEMDMPQTVSQAGVCTRDEYEAAVPGLVQAALADSCLSGNPKTPTPDDVAALFRSLW
jgi:alcohol dehydrogenase class IV